MSKEKIIAAYEALADSYNRLIEHKPHIAGKALLCGKQAVDMNLVTISPGYL